MHHPSAHHPRGQTLIIVAIGMVALIAMVGLVIDVGVQWANNRGAQNGSDAAAEAGAIVLLKNMSGASPLNTDADVESAVETAATRNGIVLTDAEYTDWQGNALGAKVGDGVIPANAQGVQVVGSRVHDTFFARIVGVSELSAFTDAVAVAGPTDPCPETSACALLPVTFPTTEVGCISPSKSEPSTTPWQGPPSAVDYVIPLCGNNPGSIGWIDWDPPNSAVTGGGGGGHGGSGGLNELAAEVCTPNPPDITLPGWFYVTSSGNPNAAPLQQCFDQWVGKTILVPLFQDTCRSKPSSGSECTDEAPIGGINQWYYFPHFAAFHLTGVYIQGSSSVCGGGGISCLTGRFVNVSLTGSVGEWTGTGAGSSPSQFFAVQLVR